MHYGKYNFHCCFKQGLRQNIFCFWANPFRIPNDVIPVKAGIQIVGFITWIALKALLCARPSSPIGVKLRKRCSDFFVETF
jgi:hypothetical protein